MKCKQIVNKRRDRKVVSEGVYYNKEETHSESIVEECGGIFRLVKLSLGREGDFIFRGRV